ncbi:SMU1112c/YaeR family gloxylase I-like metalloprotein [Vaginella massiliensis]|uniref:SMU1112c/YaeR family gloxylase I-like metalloprotein n=1 Tax=Vaginella massiliensis TaxID=1816680 RepID=UPI000B1A9F5F|nr:VOC family protein [Vaginella massiliensis]
MMKLKAIHHLAIIVSDWEKALHFYCDLLGFKIVQKHFRADRNSYKIDLSLNDRYLIELFTFDNPPARLTQPEATGLRHLAFEVEDIISYYNYLKTNGVKLEEIRIDPYTEKRFFFGFDPDNLPLEFYES